MGIVIRQSIKSSVFNYIGIALGYVNMVWLFPSILSEENFGMIRVLLSAAMLMAQFGEFGMSNTLIRYLPYFKSDPDRKRSFLGFVFLTASAVSFLLVSLLLLFKKSIFSLAGGKEVLLSEHFTIVLFIAISILFSEILFSLSRAAYKAVFPSFVKETALRILQTGVILLYYYDILDFNQFVPAFSLSYFLAMFIMFLYTKWRGILQIALPLKIGEVVSVREMLTFSFFVFLNKLPNRALNQIDVLMLGALAGLKSAGAYAIAFFIAEVVRIPARNILLVSNPLIAEAWKNKDLKKIGQMYKQSSINQLLIGGFVLVLILCNVNDFTFYLQNKYTNLYPVIALIGLAKVFDMATGINGLIISNSKYYRYSLYFNISLLALAVITNFILIPLYGIMGAALATAISVFFLNMIKTLFLKYKFSLQPFSRETFLAIIVLFVLFIFSNYLRFHYSHIINIGLRVFALSIIFFPVIYVLRLSNEINTIINGILKRIK